MDLYCPTLDDLVWAQHTFEEEEPRNLFYTVAMALIKRALAGDVAVSLAESVAVLLQTWNASYYRFHKRFTTAHFREIEALLDKRRETLTAFRPRSLDSFNPEDKPVVERLFTEFEMVLGVVGAAKCLHLLAPRFFPLWDTKIANRAYGIYFRSQGENASLYLLLMKQVKLQCTRLGGEATLGRNPLKAIDEFNYCTHTLGLKRRQSDGDVPVS